MLSFLLLHSSAAEVVITGNEKTGKVEKAAARARELLNGNSSVLVKVSESADMLAEAAPFSQEYPAEEELNIYVCRNFQCERPVQTIAGMEKLLKE